MLSGGRWPNTGDSWRRTHSHSDSHSYICMHEATHNLIHACSTGHWPPILCLAPHSRGGHVLESEGATSLQRSLHMLTYQGHLSFPSGNTPNCVWVCACLCSPACQTQWNHSFHHKRGISRQPHSSDVSIYGAHAWPGRHSTCFARCPKCLARDEVISFHSHGRLEDQDIHWALQRQSVCWVCFHLWETQQTLGNLG